MANSEDSKPETTVHATQRDGLTSETRAPSSEKPRETPGNYLRRAMKAEGLTLKELSGRTGIWPSHLSELMNGKRDFSPENLAGIRKYLNGLFSDGAWAEAHFDTLVVQTHQKTYPSTPVGFLKQCMGSQGDNVLRVSNILGISHAHFARVMAGQVPLTDKMVRKIEPYFAGLRGTEGETASEHFRTLVLRSLENIQLSNDVIDGP